MMYTFTINYDKLTFVNINFNVKLRGKILAASMFSESTEYPSLRVDRSPFLLSGILVLLGRDCSWDVLQVHPIYSHKRICGTINHKVKSHQKHSRPAVRDNWPMKWGDHVTNGIIHDSYGISGNWNGDINETYWGYIYTTYICNYIVI